MQSSLDLHNICIYGKFKPHKTILKIIQKLGPRCLYVNAIKY